MPLVAGVDSSTQSCKVVIRDAQTGQLARQGAAPHPPGTEVDPEAWWRALHTALEDAGGLDGVAAISVAAQQHGMICLDDEGATVRDALLWNDTRSADAAAELVRELPGGPGAWAEAVGSVPVAAFTITKLRWLAEHEPQHAARAAAVCLPHDWLSWRLRGAGGVAELSTDRSDASGTGYWSPAQGGYRSDLLHLALGRAPDVPTVLAPAAAAGAGPGSVIVGPGTGDNAAAALGLAAEPGDVIVSIGTSGVVSAVSARPTGDASGQVSGFADAGGAFLPLVCTLNAARVLQATARMLGVGLDELSRLALLAPPGAEGVVLVPYLDGERTPNRPDATGALHGLTGANTTPANVARAAVEGLLCGLADGLDALREQGVPTRRAVLIGGGARSAAVRSVAAGVLGLPVHAAPPGEYVADGAARQAAWVLGGDREPPRWHTVASGADQHAKPTPQVREQYREVRELTARRQGMVSNNR